MYVKVWYFNYKNKSYSGHFKGSYDTLHNRSKNDSTLVSNLFSTFTVCLSSLTWSCFLSSYFNHILLKAQSFKLKAWCKQFHMWLGNSYCEDPMPLKCKVRKTISLLTSAKGWFRVPGRQPIVVKNCRRWSHLNRGLNSDSGLVKDLWASTSISPTGSVRSPLSHGSGLAHLIFCDRVYRGVLKYSISENRLETYCKGL